MTRTRPNCQSSQTSAPPPVKNDEAQGGEHPDNPAEGPDDFVVNDVPRPKCHIRLGKHAAAQPASHDGQSDDMHRHAKRRGENRGAATGNRTDHGGNYIRNESGVPWGTVLQKRAISTQ
jgi:hypothetical protein